MRSMTTKGLAVFLVFAVVMAVGTCLGAAREKYE